MKKLALYFILSFSIISLLAIYSCSNEGNEIPTNNSVDNEFSDMVFPNFNDIIWDEVSGGTIDEEFSIISFNYNTTETNSKNPGTQCGDNNGHHGDGDDDHENNGCAYGTILHQLDLSKDQMHQIFDFKKEFHHCVNEARRNYQHEKGLVLKDAQQQRKDIIHQWKNGDITRDEANELLHNLAADTKQQIEDLKAAFKAAVGDCLCTFLKNIVSVLEGEQIETFITWVENNPCIDIECNLREGAPAD
ncbi:MAG: hypothetical protein A2X61_04960 [Ignavibacteria bacterium GWB2_35_12]|nr:MAG: hypothetical protein A2X63_11100 [Ignavibacteria bacterium GWA2_35_8]OGU41294.1 MAG: hypothetical protein A2X61_04960 [Ignavibacteria bacterium GWB2_35_12]OGU94602.1 MAG: hypothetical protein A2220_04130 [Ignavibacteria bacterium RIFOXYA2_FULL_35_10]OGV23939.1 MAG: hypothetical protein A2475_02750 [Ignavibacteria bacterium RIFOXYC2_FULL_35_21]